MIYLFDKDEQLIKVVKKSAIKTALQKYSLTNENYVSDRLTVEMKALNDDDMEKVEYMAIQSMEDNHQYHYFYVAQKSLDDKISSFIGVQSGIEELRKTVVYDKRPNDTEAKPVIDELLLGTNWRSRFVGKNSPHSTNFYYISTFEALKKICKVWNLEMQFFVEMNGNQIGARYIDFKQRIGEAVGKRVVYGHNALQILQEVERTNLFTALVGRGKGEQVSSAAETGNASDGYGRKITFEDVIWSTAKGDPLNKPKGQKFLELPAMTNLYGIKDADGSMRPKIGFIDFNEEEDPEQLLQRTYEALIDASRPQATFKTSSVYLRGVKIGDTIRVVRHDKKIDYDTRIFEITFNRLNNKSSDIKLGDRIGESNEAKAQTIADKAVNEFINNEFSNFVQKLPDFLPSADGFNNNWYGAEDPSVKYRGKVLINDIWYKPDPEHEGHQIMLRWTGEVWEEILRTYDSEALRGRIAEEVAKVTETMQRNDAEHQKGIDDLLAKAGINKSLAEEAKRIGDQAKLDAANALSKALDYKNEAIAEAQRLDTVEREETETKLATTKSQAIAEADKLVTDAKTTLETQIAGANQAISDAKQALESQVSGVFTEISKTNDTIKTLATKTDVDKTNQRVTNAETSITQQAGQIAQKANQTTVDTLSGRVKTAETSITQQANQIALKANTTDVNALTNRVGTAEAALKIHSNQIALKASQSEVDSVKSRLQNAESSLTVQADEIAQRVKSSDFDQAKQRISTAESKITQLGDRITTEISETVAKIADATNRNQFVLAGINGRTVTEAGGVIEIRHQLEPNTIYSVKTDIPKISDFYDIFAYASGSAPNSKINGLPQNESVQITTKADGLLIIVVRNQAMLDSLVNGTYHINIVKGISDVDWSPSPEDIPSEISSLKTSIAQTADGQTQLSQKLTKTDDKITSATTDIKMLVDQVSTKVSQNEFNKATGRLGTAEASIETMAGQIETKLTRIDAESIVSNAITQSEKGTNQRIAEVQGLITTDINYFSVSEWQSIADKSVSNGVPYLEYKLSPNTVYTVSTGNKRGTYYNVFAFNSNGVASSTTSGIAENESRIITTGADGILRVAIQKIVNLNDPQNWIMINIGSTTKTYFPNVKDTIATVKFNEVKDTVDSHSRTIGDMRGNISSVVMTASGLLARVNSAETGLSTVQSQLAGSWAVRNLTSSGTVLNQLNLNRDGSVKIDGKLVQITGTTYIQDGVITSAKIANLDAAKITTGTLNAANVNIVNLNANKLVGLDANFIRSKIEFAMIDWMKGKTITAQNNAMRINLNDANITFNSNATINFNSANNALVRRKGTHTAFVHFNDVSASSDGGVGSLYASIGVTSSGDGINSQSSGRFAGLRAFRGARGTEHGATVDQVEIYGDRIVLKDDFSYNRGFEFKPTGLRNGDFIDMNYLVGAVRALSRCWIHWNNVSWNPASNDLRNAVVREYNNYMKDL
ncbi:phage tail spike protein [Streptococcus sp. ZJ151]|uniref:phage tail spike protein n=1 Tax=Streptococcus jiangjianxini TaxID=3161189 RepID=UPI0032F00091